MTNETPKFDGGPAFANQSPHRAGPTNPRNEGMSLRDYFAGQVIVGLCSYLGRSGPDASGIAKSAYHIADAMLAESQQAKEGRYILFCANRFYPHGGMEDCIGGFPTKAEAIAAYEKWAEKEGVYPKGHIWDACDRQCVWEKDDGDVEDHTLFRTRGQLEVGL